VGVPSRLVDGRVVGYISDWRLEPGTTDLGLPENHNMYNYITCSSLQDVVVHMRAHAHTHMRTRAIRHAGTRARTHAPSREGSKVFSLGFCLRPACSVDTRVIVRGGKDFESES
jgi:hypothetical protein